MQCPCGSRVFIGTRCAVCDQYFEGPIPKPRPWSKLPWHLLFNPFIHVIPVWALYLMSVNHIPDAWKKTPRGATPAGFTAFMLALLTALHFLAPWIAGARTYRTKAPTGAERAVGTVLARMLTGAGLGYLFYLMMNNRLFGMH